jgi:hypothetical protein
MPPPSTGTHGSRRSWSPRPRLAARRRAGAGRPRPPKDRRGHLVKLTGVPKVNERGKAPTVEAAITWWPTTLPVAPERSNFTSSMQSPPATMTCTSVSSLRPGRARPGRSPRSTTWSVTYSIPSRSASVAGSSSPALATERRSSNATATWSSATCKMASKKASSGAGIMTACQPSFSLVRGPFSQSAHHRRSITDSVERGSVWACSRPARARSRSGPGGAGSSALPGRSVASPGRRPAAARSL